MEITIADNEDLLIEILLWVPAKSLIRFKSVCKRWLTIISSHQFSNQHTLRQRSRPRQDSSLLLRLTEKSNYFYLQSSFHVQKLVPYHFSPTLVGPITIWSFSNGLFLLQCRNTEDPFKVFHVYNPTTRQSRKILLDMNDVYICVVGLNLVFDPQESPHYKVLCVRAAKKSSSFLCRSWWRHCQIEIYESKTSSWNFCGKPFVAPRSLQFDHGIYWKGGIHWEGGYFDLQDCALRNRPRIIVPGDTGTNRLRENYMEYNGYLHNIAHFPEEKKIMIFELQNTSSEWSLKYRINVDAVSGPLSVLNIVRGEEEGDGMLVVYEAGKVRGYKLQENCVKELIDFTVDPLYLDASAQFTSDRALRLNETLAPV
ncbi:hypothetical protein ACS0TY_000304 [Phlomoides rotata]